MKKKSEARKQASKKASKHSCEADPDAEEPTNMRPEETHLGGGLDAVLLLLL
jgi:hypothetical protein